MARVITPEEKYRKEMAILFKKAESKKWKWQVSIKNLRVRQESLSKKVALKYLRKKGGLVIKG